MFFYSPTHPQIYLSLISYYFFSAPETVDEPYAWESREFLRKKVIGKEVLFTVETKTPTGREYGAIYIGKGECATFSVFLLSPPPSSLHLPFSHILGLPWYSGCAWLEIRKVAKCMGLSPSLATIRVWNWILLG